MSAASEQSSMLGAAEPSVWPDPPAEMTVSTLLNIEACPRRWALLNAAYPDVWDQRGYPPALQIAALTGTVIHSAVELIVRALVSAGCRSVADPTAVEVLVALEGYTAIVNKCIDRALAPYATNPRVVSQFDRVGRLLRSQVPDIRSRVQGMLRRVNLSGGSLGSNKLAKTGERLPLSLGAYPEIEVRAPILGWKGRIDLLNLSSELCEIVDFKTGREKENDRFQALLYALIWSHDTELNPTGRLANRLTVAYLSSDFIAQGPTASELQEIEYDAVNRRNRAVEAAQARPPQARPTEENCGFCAVRHLCSSYWTREAQIALLKTLEHDSFVDVELQVTGYHGARSWDGLITLLGSDAPGKSCLLRLSSDVPALGGDMRVRILNARLLLKDESGNDCCVIALSTSSEVFVLASR